MNIELTTNNKIEFLKQMIRELEAKQVEPVLPQVTKPMNAVQPEAVEFTDNKNVKTTYGPQWLLVKKVWGNNQRTKICFKLKPSWMNETLVKVILMKDYKFIAQNMAKRLFNKNYTQYSKLLNTLNEGLTNKYVFTSVNEGVTNDYAYSVGDFDLVVDSLNDETYEYNSTEKKSQLLKTFY